MLKTFTLIAGFLVCATLAQSQLVITAVFDADLPGGLPKGVELYALDDIADLSIFGLGSANNGGGSDGEELTLSGSATKGQFIYVSSDSASFNEFFGFDSDFQGDAMLINGDDAVELFMNGNVVDVFGEIDVDGNGTPWEYLDGWAARKSGTGPDGSTFVLANWTFSGPGGLDGEATNEGAAAPVPIMEYSEQGGGGPDVTVIAMNLAFTPRDITIEIGQTVRWSNPETNVAHNVNGSQDAFPCNPVSFFSGVAEDGPWDYDFTFNQAGFYEYQCDPHISSDMFGSVTVVDPNAPDAPSYDIPLVTTVDENGVADSAVTSTFCTLEGIVYGTNARPGGLQFTIIDDNGDGIGVFKSGSDCYEVTEGDRIRVTGNIDQFNGLTQIEPTENIEVLSEGNTLLPPVDLPEPMSEEYESKFLSIEGMVVVDSIIETGGSGWNVFVTADAFAATFLIRIDADIFPDQPMILDAPYFIRGIGSQFDTESPYLDGYQIIPQEAEHIDKASSVNLLPPDALQLYPNPTSDLLTIKTTFQVEGVQVRDMHGRQVSAFYDGRNLDTGHLAAGTYVLTVTTPDGLWNGKFIKVE